MKKIFMLMALMCAVFSANAQIATQNSNALDNISVSLGGGVTTPLDLNDIFPLNGTASVAVGKWFSTVFGAEVEGTAWFGSHAYDNTRFGANVTMNVAPVGVGGVVTNDVSFNAVRGHYVGVNGLVNLTNLFCGYKGTPRTFEISTVLGSGWIHTYTPNTEDKAHNGLGVKTGLDLAFNLGKAKAHTISVRPAVLWDVTSAASTMPLQFDKRNAQLYLGVAYTYHFKTSNGTHHFKTYDIGEMVSRIAYLQGALDECEKQKPDTVKVIVEKQIENTVVVTENNTSWTINFKNGSDKISEDAALVLNGIGTDSVVDVVGTASPNGGEVFNQRLSEKRAKNVADYLTNRGVKVNSFVGKGINPTTGRAAIITVTK